MIEVFNAKRTRSFGCYASFRSAEDTLNRLARENILGDVPCVSISAYRNNELQREYQAVFVGGKWRMPKERKKRAIVACNAGDLGSVPGLGRSPGEGNGYPLQYSGLENSMDYTVTKSQTWLSDFHFMIYKHWDEDCTCPISFQASPPSCKIGNILRFIFQIRKLRLGEYPTESGRVLLGGAEL